MKKIILALDLFIAFSASFAYGQNINRIKEIRQLYNEYIDVQKELDYFTLTFENCLECAIIYNFYMNQSDKLIVNEILSGEYNGSIVEYYFKNDEIFFVFYKYSEVIDFDENGHTITREIELRFYFQNGKVINTLKKEIKEKSNSENLNFKDIPNTTVSYLLDSTANMAFNSLHIKKILQMKNSIKSLIYN